MKAQRKEQRNTRAVELIFEPITRHAPGVLAQLLARSYAELIETDAEFWGRVPDDWERGDREAFESPDTVGACVFITTFAGETVGFGSFDPRQAPATGAVGHHCILPAFRGRGFGKRQVEEILRRLVERSASKAVATTSAHPFFLPARRTYEACGFVEIARTAGGPDPTG